MGFVKDCNDLKKVYTMSELKKYMYNHYYYIVDKIYFKHDGKINKKDIENCLMQGIIDYLSKSNDNPSRCIHNRMVSLEKSYHSKKVKEDYHKLLKLAYSGNFEARRNLFFKHADKIDKRIIEIYEMYLNIVTLDSIANFLYQEMWCFVNRYFDGQDMNYYYSTRFSNQLNSTCDKLIRHINSTIGYKVKSKKKGRG